MIDVDVCLRSGCGKEVEDGSGYCSDVCFHEDWHLDSGDVMLVVEEIDVEVADIPWELP